MLFLKTNNADISLQHHAPSCRRSAGRRSWCSDFLFCAFMPLQCAHMPQLRLASAVGSLTRTGLSAVHGASVSSFFPTAGHRAQRLRIRGLKKEDDCCSNQILDHSYQSVSWWAFHSLTPAAPAHLSTSTHTCGPCPPLHSHLRPLPTSPLTPAAPAHLSTHTCGPFPPLHSHLRPLPISPLTPVVLPTSPLTPVAPSHLSTHTCCPCPPLHSHLWPAPRCLCSPLHSPYH